MATANCFPNPPPVNPLSQLLLSTLGSNFFPPFNAGFQPVDTSAFTEEKLLQFQLPGGGKIKGVGDPNHLHLSEYVTPLIGAIGTVFSFFAPLFLILDVIRAIIDIICALFNPVPLILTIVDLFVAVLPPIIALFPPFSGVLLGINVAKLIVALIGSLVASFLPIIDEIVTTTQTVIGELANGNISIVDIVTLKICQLLQEFANKIGGLLPISFILELINIFMSIGSKFFCAPSSPCCTEESCPPIIINPPGGKAKVTRRVEKFTVKDLIAAVINLINIPLQAITDFVNATLNPVLEVVSNILNNIVGVIVNMLSVLNAVLVGALQGIIDALTLNAVNLNVPKLDFTIPIPDIFDDIILVQPETELFITTHISTANPNGLLSSAGVGFNYSSADMSKLPIYVVEPDKIPAPGSDPDPATMRVRVTRGATNVLQRVRSTDGSSFVIRDDSFPLNSVINYVFIPDEINLIKLDLIGLGCQSDITKAKSGLDAFIEADAGAVIPGTSSKQSVFSKIGETQFPPLPTDQFNQLLAQITADPKTGVDPTPILNQYLDTLGKFTDKLVCIGASSIRSQFTVSKQFPQQDEPVTLTLLVRDAGGNPLLIGGVLPTSSFRAEFYTTFGDISPVVFHPEDGTFTATITASEPGTATVEAAFIVREKECIRAKNFDGFTVTPNVQPIQFVPTHGSAPRVRRRDQFIQSRGGRVRR